MTGSTHNRSHNSGPSGQPNPYGPDAKDLRPARFNEFSPNGSSLESKIQVVKRNPFAFLAAVVGVFSVVIVAFPAAVGLLVGVAAIGLGVLALVKRQSRKAALVGVLVGAFGVLFSLSAFGSLVPTTDTADAPVASELPSLTEVTALMPEVVGSTVELAESDIARAGYDGEVEIIGGGLFGVIDETQWEVCAQLPEAGELINTEPRLTVERNCNEPEAEAPRTSTDATPSSVENVANSEPESTSGDDEDSLWLEEDDEELAIPVRQSVDASAIEARFVEHLNNNFIDDVGSMCDSAHTHWSCFYRGVEGQPGFLQINLKTDGGWSSSDLEDMADRAGLHWFNFIGCDFPNLDTIVVNINGLDHNVFRSAMKISC